MGRHQIRDRTGLNGLNKEICSIRMVPLAGFCFYWMWIAVVFYSDAVGSNAVDSTDLVESFWLWATWAHAVALLLHAFVAGIIPSILFFRPLRLASGIGMAFGCVLVSFSALASPLDFALAPIGSVLVGVSSAWHVIAWGELYSMADFSEATLLSAFSFLVGLLGYFLILVFPSEIRMATACVLPVASTVVLEGAFRQDALLGVGDSHRNVRIDIASGRTVASLSVLLTCLFAFALCGETLRVFSLRLADAALNQTGAFYLVGGVVGLLMLALTLLYRNSLGKSQISLSVIRAMLLIMAAAFLAAPCALPYLFSACYGLFGAGFWCFRCVSWILCLSIVGKMRLSPVCVISAMDAAFSFAVVVSGQVNSWIAEAILIGKIEVITVSLVAVFVLMSISLFVLNDEQVKIVLDPNGLRGLDDGDEDSGSAGADSSAVDLVSENVMIAARVFGLSSRETEVAALLARGRSLPFIQEELCISAGTSQTHARHIYKKMGVHSRQEFIDVILNMGGK